MDTKALRQKILDLAIHGKLVPQDPNDEPASVLLERIKAEKERLIKEGKIKRSKKSAKSSDTPHYEQMPFEVPDSWEWTTIGNLCSKIGSGSTPKGSNYSSEGVLFFRSQNVHNDGILLDDIKYISDEVHQSMIGTEVLPNDLLLNITGGSLGRCAIVPNEIDKGNVSQHVCILRPIIISSNYFHALILSTFFSKSMKITGSGREGLPKYNLEQMMFPLPPLAEQHRIVTEIERWFFLIDIIESSKEDLQTAIKQAKNKILDLAIHGKLVPQDPNDEPASELLKRINPKAEITCDNGHYTFDVPSGWITTNLGSIFNVVSAKRILKSDWKHSGVPFYRAREIAKLSIYGLVDNELYISEEHYNSLKEKFPVPKASDIMISAVGTIGKCYIVKESDKFYYKDASVLCLCNDYQINTKYIYHIMRSEYMLKQMYDNSKGTTVDTITIEKAKQYILPLPPLAEQQRIVAKIEETFSIFDGIQNSLEA
ncbi:restriction endonuclease subunit S [Phocaeicola vulgatus]|uniref:EcoKI-like type I restriction enzyme specificity protein n=1 Tax=Phocaeicola vulgatus TaxID=821 RepID=A0A414GK53_PHOVU|nr:restriction endonuclease subunit S [Phocaeicola vulgatus]RHD69172.1 restriction endonuclease subunit S [Phocaeicola vulgatus]TSE46517.1 EcoKI-like type I restriction enzyme specificity protein [Phocaeicola vulgatus]TSE50827.1 EcoKI-like type I restriction enzyme specificity protein [Phocaeicola vulgatus]